MNLLVLNPKSGNAEDGEFWREHFHQAGVVVEPDNVTEAQQLRGLKASDCLIVAGGDGTLRRYAATCAEIGCTLGVLPSGTGNDIARGVTIPLEPDAACRNLADGVTRKVDIGLIDDEIFLNAAHIGLGPEISRNVDRAYKHWWGRYAYWRTLLDRVQRTRGFKATIRCDDEFIHGRWLQITVANGRSFGGGQRFFEATPFDGRLDLIAIRPHPVYQLFFIWLLARFRGAAPDSEAFEQYRGTDIEILGDSSKEVTADGELIAHLPVRFAIRPKALRVVIPRTSIPNWEKEPCKNP